MTPGIDMGMPLGQRGHEMTLLRSQFTESLQAIDQRLLAMGTSVGGMVNDAITSLATYNETLAQEVILRDAMVDELDIEIETQCMHLLALQQPVAKDLRVIGTALNIIKDLERIGDYAVDIAGITLEFLKTPARPALPPGIAQMAAATALIVQQALDAYVQRDEGLVRVVVEADAQINDLYTAIWQQLIVKRTHRGYTREQAMHLVLAARYLERITDHAINVVERIHYIETGVLQQFTSSHPTHVTA